jgi:hypothetical protein
VTRRGLVLAAALLAPAPGANAEGPASGGRGTLYLAARPGQILILDEATFRPLGSIPLPKTAPGPSYPLQLTQDRKRFLSYSGNLEDIEVVDIASRKVVDQVRLSEGNRKVRFDGYDGGGESTRYLALAVRAATKLVDRFEIGPKTLLEYDLQQRKAGRTIPWPRGEEREQVELRYSRDGKLLYVFAEDVFIYDTADFRLVDTWELSRPVEGGFGRVELGPADDYWEEPGFVTGVFEVADPVQHRRLTGIARMDLAARTFDFWTVGPARPLRAFSLAPGRKKAHALLQEIGSYELWTFDLVGRRLEKRTPFAGRPRMDMAVSSNGQVLYVYGAGNTIDLFDAQSHRFLRTVTLDFEVTHIFVFPEER